MAIARAVVHAPALLLADEPTGNLDEATAREIIPVLLSLARARSATLIIVTHDAALARRADRVLELRDGRLHAAATVKLLHAASLRHLLRHPAQLALALLGLTLGVGTIVAVDIATASSRRAFELSLAAVNGAATHQLRGGPRGIDEALYVRLRAAARCAGGAAGARAPRQRLRRGGGSAAAADRHRPVCERRACRTRRRGAGAPLAGVAGARELVCARGRRWR